MKGDSEGWSRVEQGGPGFDFKISQHKTMQFFHLSKNILKTSQTTTSRVSNVENYFGSFFSFIVLNFCLV